MTPRIRVLINAAAVRTGGGGTFAVSQISALARRDGFDLTVIAAGDVAAHLERLGGVRVHQPPSGSLLVRLLWEHVVLAARSRHFDVLYCVGNFALPLAPAPQVVAMQNALHFGAVARGVRVRHVRPARLRLRLESALARVSVRRAFAVVAVSRSLRTAIEEDVGTRYDVRVLPSAAPLLSAAGPPAQTDPYVVSVANDHPHKDWDALVALFADHRDLPPLVAVGRFSDARRDHLEALAAGRVQFVGPIVDRAELAGLYGGATCCIVHSRVESFGLTALEALACGIPVVVSDIPAHREVCRDSVMYYDPEDTQALARSVRNVAAAAPPAAILAHPWTWDDNARGLARVLVAAAESGGFDDRP